MAEPRDPEEPPQYTKYRAGRGGLKRGRKPADPTAVDPRGPRRPPREPRAPGAARERVAPAQPSAQPQEDYARYGAPKQRRRVKVWRPSRPKVGRTIAWLWLLKRLLVACVAWFLVAVASFAISATIHQSGSGGNALGGGGLPPFSATNILVLGSDARPKGSKEPGASTSGPSRSDTMLLLRVGGGHNARLSIPRDTVAEIPGHGRAKINAAYAFGGAELAVQTVETLLGIQINHLIEINFENFPDLIDAMGGVDYKGGCVVSRINGGFKNGGFTLRLRRGRTHINGKQALALARTRHNDCNKRENDLTRERRQQKLLTAMKSRVMSISGFLRGPFIGWNAPKAIKSDMSAPTLFGVFSALATSGTPKTEVLRPTGAETLPDGGAGLTVSPAARSAAATRFLKH